MVNVTHVTVTVVAAVVIMDVVGVSYSVIGVAAVVYVTSI